MKASRSEDGIGLVRQFEDGFGRLVTRRHVVTRQRTVARQKRDAGGNVLTVVTGEMFGPRLGTLLAEAGSTRRPIRVAAVPNDFFGPAIGVAGLLTGRESSAISRGRLISAARCSCGRGGADADGIFLDDLTPADLARTRRARQGVRPTPGALLKAIRDS